MPAATVSKKVLVPWETADEAGYVLPEGKYILKIQEATVGQTQSGTQAVTIKYLVLKPDKFKGRTTNIIYAFTPPGLRSLREVVAAVLGDVPRKASALDLSKLEGKVIKATATIREGRNGGKFQELREIERYGKAPEPEPEQEEDDGLGDVGDDDLEIEDGDDGIPF